MRHIVEEGEARIADYLATVVDTQGFAEVPTTWKGAKVDHLPVVKQESMLERVLSVRSVPTADSLALVVNTVSRAEVATG